ERSRRKHLDAGERVQPAGQVRAAGAAAGEQHVSQLGIARLRLPVVEAPADLLERGDDGSSDDLASVCGLVARTSVALERLRLVVLDLEVGGDRFGELVPAGRERTDEARDPALVDDDVGDTGADVDDRLGPRARRIVGEVVERISGEGTNE